MSRTLVRALALLPLGVAAPVWAAGWSLGAHLGAGTVQSGKTSGSSTVVALPSNALTYQPAFRIGFGDSRHAHDAYIDAGALVIDQAGSTLSLVVSSLNYQHVLAASSPSGPFVNAGFGFLREGGAMHTTTKPNFGAGVGYRRVTRDGHGALRVEARVDFLQGDDDFGRPDLTTVGLRLGFDLWL